MGQWRLLADALVSGIPPNRRQTHLCSVCVYKCGHCDEAIMHEKPEQTPLARVAHSSLHDTPNHSHRQSHQNINAVHNQSFRLATTFNASYVPGYFTPGIAGKKDGFGLRREEVRFRRAESGGPRFARGGSCGHAHAVRASVKLRTAAVCRCRSPVLSCPLLKGERAGLSLSRRSQALGSSPAQLVHCLRCRELRHHKLLVVPADVALWSVVLWGRSCYEALE
jgi:hypothetical protein